MNAIVIFVKAPAPGRVKTRLCPPLSHEEAAGLYRAFVEDTVALAARVGGAGVQIAFDAADQYRDLSWIKGAASLPFFIQEGNDLGERLIQASKRAFDSGAQKVVCIGADCPYLDAAEIKKAFELLKTNDVVLGPAEDGGYYLVAAKKHHPGLFQEIPWSSDKVLKETLGKIKKLGMTHATLPVYSDIDTFGDLWRLVRAIKSGRGAAPVKTKAAIESLFEVLEQGLFEYEKSN